MGARMRRLIEFPCAGETLFGTLDEAPGTTGLLIVSGGNEIRIGAHRGMAQLARRVAEAGYPVFRFDRRGIGDSTGENHGFESSADDIVAAAAAFRQAAPRLTRIAAFGNCDAATALVFFHARAGIHQLVLANPWVIEATDDLPPAAAIRARYAERLRDPREWLRLLRGGVDIRKLISGLFKAFRRQSQQSDSLSARLATAFTQAGDPVTILLAKGDNTAIAFRDAYAGSTFETARAKIRLEELDSASHSFATAADKQWLFEQIMKNLP